jgi:NADPH-dependent 2,4-dienoyl-CoA reductase/sulfur reductase-like enzyme
MSAGERGAGGALGVRTAQLAVVGAGPAGLSAAAEAARHGVSVVLLDDNPLPGGQYLRQGPATRTRGDAPGGPGRRDAEHARQARELLSVVSHPHVEFLGGAVVWAAPAERTLAFTREGRGDRLRAEIVVVAAGAGDRAVPFPGWTLPGVLTAGGAQNLLKSQGVLPGRRAVVSGTGPLLLVVADSLRRAGATVVEVLDSAPRGRQFAALPRLAARPDLVWRGIACRAGLAAAGIRLRWGATVIEARGRGEVGEAVVAPIDPAGRVDRTRARAIAADTIVVGFGLAPATELTRLLGCAHDWNLRRGGWIPRRSADLETSVAGVLAVGDGAGIGGAETAMLEGQLAGLVAAGRLGRCPPGEVARRRGALRSRLERLVRFREGVEALYAPPPDYLSLLTPETIVCRCEEVTAAQLADGLSRGFASADALKGATRVGMGVCQGRNCLRTLADLIARARGDRTCAISRIPGRARRRAPCAWATSWPGTSRRRRVDAGGARRIASRYFSGEESTSRRAP